MITVIAIPSTTDISCYALVVIVCRSHETIEIIIHPFLVDEISFLDSLTRFAEEITCIKAEFLQLGITFILLIVTNALGIVKSDKEIPEIAQFLVEKQLIVLLMIEILLVIIILHITILIVV